MTILEHEQTLLHKLALCLKESTEKYSIISTLSTKRCVPVIHKQKHEKPLLTTKTTHICLLFSPQKVPILALEVFTYLNFYSDNIEKLIYVSKADTTGLDTHKCALIGPFISEYLMSICELPFETLLKDMNIKSKIKMEEDNEKVDTKSTFISRTHFLLNVLERRASGDTEYLLNHNDKLTVIEYLHNIGVKVNLIESGDMTVKLVLFTRSEGQYLFPESMKNSGKHILDGNQLLKWWLKNVDYITSYWNCCERYLDILNCEEREVFRYFPGLSNSWKHGNVYHTNDKTRDIAIYNIPLLPDDPKGRFLEHLIVEGRAKKVDLKRYWQELAVRQEFSFGAVVGIIGIKGSVKPKNDVLFQHLSPTESKELVELITTKDYSDQSDWGQLFDEVQSLDFLHIFKTQGKLSNYQKRKNDSNVSRNVNTLLCIRKKSKK